MRKAKWRARLKFKLGLLIWSRRKPKCQNRSGVINTQLMNLSFGIALNRACLSIKPLSLDIESILRADSSLLEL